MIHQRSPSAARPPVARSPLLGTVIGGKYRILRAIGSGGMGTVFEAESLASKRLVAVKVVSRPESADALARFAREAAIVSSIRHPNICEVHDVGALPSGGPYIVLERLQGETLAARLVRRSSVADLVDLFVQILSGLHAAHASQILHRDLKPQNIFLVDRVGCGPLVKIVDFGLARDLSSNTRLTRPGRLCGTVQYMSPEQLRGEPLDPRSDLFSAGVLFYEVLTRRHPFVATTSVGLQANILHANPAPLRTLRPDVPAALEAMIVWAMARLPGDRPSSALELQRGILNAVTHGQLPVDEPEPLSLTNPMWMPPSSSPAA